MHKYIVEIFHNSQMMNIKKKHLVKNQYFAMYTYISIEWVFLLFFLSFLYISVTLGWVYARPVAFLMSFPCVCRRLFDKSVYYYLGLRWVATRLWWLCSKSNIICFFARETLCASKSTTTFNLSSALSHTH